MEDQQLIQEAFEMLAPTRGRVRFINDGQAALEFLSVYSDAYTLPRLIVLDLNMPKLSGVDTLKVLKSNDLLKDIPVIIFSSSFNPADIEISKKAGAIEYLTKPNTFVQFKAIAEKFASYCV
jgi:CheY-like chemotaxis protein